MGDGRHSLIQRITLRTQTAKAERENGTLKILEERDILKNPFDNTPVFFEPDGNGNNIPVKIRFYGFGRWFRAALKIFLTVSMPAIIAAVLRLAEMSEGESFMAGYRPEYGAAWYVTAGFFSLIYLVKGMRREVYEHPLVYEILPGGKLHLIDSQKDTQKIKKQKKQKKQKKEGIFSVISDLGGIGKFLAGTLLLIFFVSIAAIIS